MTLSHHSVPKAAERPEVISDPEPSDGFGIDYFKYSVRADAMALRRRLTIPEVLEYLDSIRDEIEQGVTL